MTARETTMSFRMLPTGAATPVLAIIQKVGLGRACKVRKGWYKCRVSSESRSYCALLSRGRSRSVSSSYMPLVFKKWTSSPRRDIGDKPDRDVRIESHRANDLYLFKDKIVFSPRKNCLEPHGVSNVGHMEKLHAAGKGPQPIY